MSMIIRDFHLPKAGEVLILKIYPDRGVVESPGTECEARDNIVVPIPERHGRLIDADALENTINYDLLHRDKDDGFSTKSIWSYIQDAPTILEAEE